MTELERYVDPTPEAEQALRGAAPRMSPYAKGEMRERVVAFATAASAGRWTRHVLARAAAIAIGFSAAAGGVSAAAASSVPGDALYPAKRAAEVVKLTLARSSGDVKRLLGQLADERAEELTALVVRGADESRVDAAAESFDRAADIALDSPGPKAKVDIASKVADDAPAVVREKVEREVREHAARPTGKPGSRGKPSGRSGPSAGNGQKDEDPGDKRP